MKKWLAGLAAAVLGFGAYTVASAKDVTVSAAVQTESATFAADWIAPKSDVAGCPSSYRVTWTVNGAALPVRTVTARRDTLRVTRTAGASAATVAASVVAVCGSKTSAAKSASKMITWPVIVPPDTTPTPIDSTPLPVDSLRVDTARVVVTPPVDTVVTPPSGNPSPSGTVHFDTRAGRPQSIQAAQSIDQALNAVRSGPGVSFLESNLAFTTNVDGANTRAFRAEWSGWGGQPQDQARVLMPSLRSAPRDLYVQWRHKLGKTATGGGVGSNGFFDITNGNDPGGNAGRKLILFLRADASGGSRGRIDLTWPGPSPVRARMEGFYDLPNAPNGMGENLSVFDYDGAAQRGESLLITIHVVVGDGTGVLEWWVNGVQRGRHTGLRIGAGGIDRFHLLDTFRSPIQAQTEYVWDVVAWTP